MCTLPLLMTTTHPSGPVMLLDSYPYNRGRRRAQETAASLLTSVEDRRKVSPNEDEDRLTALTNEWLAGRGKQDYLFSVSYGHGNQVGITEDKIIGRNKIALIHDCGT